VGGPDAERRRWQRDGECLRGGGQKPLSTFYLEVVNFVYFDGRFDKFVFPDYTEGYLQKLRATLPCPLTVLSSFACCTKIIIIQYSQAMIENLVIYSGARECNPGQFLQSLDFWIELA